MAKYIQILHLFLLLMVLPSLLSGNENISFDSIACKIEQVSFSNGAKARKMLEELCESGRDDADSIRKHLWCIYLESVIDEAQGSSNPHLILKTDSLLKQLESAEFPFERALLQYSLALEYITKGDYGEAFAWALQAMEQFQEYNDRIFTAKALMLLGNVCTYIKSLNMAEDYYNQAALYVALPQAEHYRIYLHRYNLLFYSGKREEAIDSLLRFVPVLEAQNDKGLLAIAYMNLGAYYGNLNRMEQAYPYYAVLQELMKDIDNKRLTTALYQNLGFYYASLGNFEQAKSYFNGTKELAIEDRNISRLFYAFYGLSRMYGKHSVNAVFFFHVLLPTFVCKKKQTCFH